MKEGEDSVLGCVWLWRCLMGSVVFILWGILEVSYVSCVGVASLALSVTGDCSP